MDGQPRDARPRLVALTIFVVSAALIGGAYYFEYGLGLLPCELCLKQRQPYYIAMPIAAVLALMPDARRDRLFTALRAFGFGVIAIAFLYNAGLGVYHSGAEWHLWLGPADCTGPVGSRRVSMFGRWLKPSKNDSDASKRLPA